MARVLELSLPLRGRLADDEAGSDETKRRIAELLDHPQDGLNARIDALMGRIPEDLVIDQLERGTSSARERSWRRTSPGRRSRAGRFRRGRPP